MISGPFTGTPIIDTDKYKLVSKGNDNYLIGPNLSLAELDLSDLDMSGTINNPIDLTTMNLANCILANVNLDNTILSESSSIIELSFSDLVKLKASGDLNNDGVIDLLEIIKKYK